MCRSAGKWTPEEIERLKVLRADGWSKTAIGNALGRTRNSVSGKINRLQVPTPFKVKVAVAPRAPTLRRARVPVFKPRPPPRLPAAAPLSADIVTAPIPFMSRTALQCAAITEGRDGDGLAMCCGQPVFGLSSWCATHFLAYLDLEKGKSDGQTRNRHQ